MLEVEEKAEKPKYKRNSKKVVLPEFAQTTKLLTRRQTMELLGMSEHTLWKYTLTTSNSDRIPSVKVGRSRKYRYDQILYWIDNHSA